ncbi:MAG: hypothetical protein WBE86_16370 [Candidatus Acidiferrales bacterium]
MKPSKLSWPRKATAAGLGGVLFAAALEAIKMAIFPKITIWQSHIVTIMFCAALAFFLSAMFLRREQIKLNASMARTREFQ